MSECKICGPMFVGKCPHRSNNPTASERSRCAHGKSKDAPCLQCDLDQRLLYEQQSAIRIAALAKEVAELRALADRASDAGEKWKAELAAEREAYDTKLAYAGLKEACEQALEERDTARAELKQTDERCQEWIAEATRLRPPLALQIVTAERDRLRGLLERVLNGKVHIGELCQALERKP